MMEFIKSKIIIFLAFVSLGIGLALLFISKNVEYRNQFGDWMGGTLNPWFTLACFIVMFVAFNTQSKELSTQIQEMNENQELMKQEKFENSIFKLINIYMNAINRLSVDSSLMMIDIRKRHFDVEQADFEKSIKDGYKISGVDSIRLILKHFCGYTKFDDLISQFDKKINLEIDSIYRSAYCIINYIDNYFYKETKHLSNSINEKKSYVKLFTNQITIEEIILIGLVGITKKKEHNINTLNILKKYDFFEELNTSNIDKLLHYTSEEVIKYLSIIQ